MNTVFAVGQHRKLGLLPEGEKADIPSLELPTSGPSDDVIDLEPECPPVHNQGSVGDCASVSACTWFYEFLQRRGRFSHAASWTAFYAWVRLMAGRSLLDDSGSTIADTINTAMLIGFCPADVYPINDNAWDVQPPGYAHDAASQHRMLFSYYCPTVETIDASLAQGFPVAFGMTLTESFQQVGGDGIYIPKGPDIGGHGMGIIGVDNTMSRAGYRGFYKVRNQWSEGFGQHGNVFVPKVLFMDGTAREMVTARRTEVK